MRTDSINSVSGSNGATFRWLTRPRERSLTSAALSGSRTPNPPALPGDTYNIMRAAACEIRV